MEQRDNGFTLVEVLVALTIFSLVAGALFQELSSGWRGLRRASAADNALAVAKLHLASAGVETPLQASERSGISADGIRWTELIVPYAAPGAQAVTAPPLAFWVRATATWKEGLLRPEQSIALRTIKLGQPRLR